MTCAGSVDDGIDTYSKLHREADAEERVGSYKQLVNAYYDLATVFYEWGWGSCFHFAARYPFETTFAEAIRRHEYVLAAQLDNCYGPSKHVLDVGCGIGGPARNISKFLQCQITGITLNPYQVARGNELNATKSEAQLGNHVTCVQGDFMALPFPKASFDGAYAIEATCHAPDRTACYRQVYQALKPGTVFACYEWCMTDAYDPANAEHLRLKKDIEEGNGLPDICTTKDCLKAMEAAGFTIVTESDLAADVRGMSVGGGGGGGSNSSIQPWMTPLQPSWNITSQRFQFNCVGAVLTNGAIRLLECLRLAPAGTVKTQQVLQAGGFALRDAGNAGIFTTMYLMVGRKPLHN